MFHKVGEVVCFKILLLNGQTGQKVMDFKNAKKLFPLK